MADTVTLGGGGVDGYFGKNPDWSKIKVKTGRTIWSSYDDNTLQAWFVEDTNAGGVLLAGGNYANPIQIAGNGLPRIAGYFASGFVFENPNQVGIDASGNSWQYVGTSPLPYTVTAGTVPSAPDYELVFTNDHNNLTNRNAVGAHDDIYIRTVTLAEAIIEDAPVETVYFIKDKSINNYYVVDSSLYTGEVIATLTNGNKLRRAEFSQARKSIESLDWYVDQSTGVDDLSNGRGLDPLKPFKTIQFCIDAIPEVLSDRCQQTINLVAGVYSESSRPASSMPRPAIVYPSGKFISRRTSQSGSDLSGSIIIKGAGVGVSIVETDPANGYVNGVYVSGTEIGLQDLTVRPKAGQSTSTCITSHRGAYVHGRNLEIGGVGASLGLVNESGGWSEMVSCTITGSDNGDVVVFPTSGCSLAGSSSNIGDVQSSGFIQFAQQLIVNGNVSVTSSGSCQITSDTLPNGVVFNGSFEISNSPLSAAFASFNGSITATFSNIKLASCSYQKSITMFGGGLELNASNSYISPNTQNDTASPVVLRNGARIDKDSSSQIINSSGVSVGADYGNLSVSVNSDNFNIPVSITGKSVDIEVIGAGSNRIGALLPSSSGTGVYPDGLVLRLVGAGFNVTITEGSTANIPSGSVTIGGLTGGYSGVTFVYSSRSSKWNLQGVGLIN